MSSRLSRRQVARYLVDQLTQNRAAAVQMVAAWLVASRRSRQYNYMARDVAQELEARGYLFAHVTAAQPLAPGSVSNIRQELLRLTQAKEIELHVSQQPKLIGGVLVQTPSATLDASVHAATAQLQKGLRS